MKKDIQKFIDFLIYSEKLKTEYRHAHKNDGNRESAAEHSWRLSLMLMLVAPKLSKKIDLLKAMKMATVHDIVEIDAEDVLVLDHIDNKSRKDFKDEEEKRAIKKVASLLGESGEEIRKLWYEYFENKTYEAKVLHVLNMFEGQSQFLSEDVKKFSHEEQDSVRKLIKKTTELSEVDPYLTEIYEACGNLFRERTRPL